MELVNNQPAVLFWENVYSKLNIVFDEKKQIIDDEECLIQSFQI